MTRPRHESLTGAAGEGDLRDIKIAARIDPDAVRGEEVAGVAWIRAAAPTRVQFAGTIEDADATARVTRLRIASTRPASGTKAELGDIEKAGAIDGDLARSGDVSP